MKHLTTVAIAATIGIAGYGAAVLAQPPAAAPGAAPAAGRPAPPPVTGTVTPLPDNLKPTRVSGSGITCANLEAQKNWYVNILGMHVVRTLERNGAAYEYVLSTETTRGPQTAVLALLAGTRQPGATSYGRFILNVKDADATAAFLRTHGIAARNVSAGAYFIQDPEGNNVEIYQPDYPAGVVVAPAPKGK
jgi:catechol 2,3-dioxygenase-like lactoylglutathione lyase family enzyme